MDSEYQAVGIKQEVETNEINGTVNAAHMKLEQEDPTYGIQCYGIKVEPSDDTWCTTATDGNVQVKTEVKFEKLDHGEYVDIEKFEKIDNLDLNEEVDVKLEGEPSTTSDCATKKEKWGDELQVDCAEAESGHIIKNHPEFIGSVDRKIYECSYCALKTLNKFAFDQHIRIHSTDRVITCTHCHAGYKTQRALDEHIVRRHSQFLASVSRKISSCTYCNFKTTIKRNLHKHLLKHHEAASKYKTTKKDTLTSHMLTHPNAAKTKKWGREVDRTEAETGLFICYNCTYTALSKTGLMQHIGACKSGVTSKIRPSNVYVCARCDKVFKNKPTLDDHVIKNHVDSVVSVSSKIHDCPHCNYKSTSKNNVTKHIAAKHSSSMKRSLDDHILRLHRDFSASQKFYECSYCDYKTIKKCNIDEHTLKHPEAASSHKLFSCEHCKVTYKRKLSLDNHIVKNHPEFIASVTRKVHDAPKKKKRVTEIQVAHREAESELCICYSCNFRARSKTQLIKHINSGKCSAQAKMEITETETSLSCRRCFKVFKTKRTLDDHVIKMHIDFIESVSSKIHECAHCDYKTTNKNNANRHMLTHSDVIPKLCVCEHCKASFVNQLVLDNHIVQKHSKFMTTVKSYIHSCTHCTYKSTIKKYFKQHIWSHSSDKPGECKHCTATFKTKRALYEHVVKKHPDFSASITACKVYKCSYCEFKTIQKLSLDRHMVNHPNKYNPLTCKYCEATFTRKKILNDHMMKKHPDFKEAVSDKIHECSYCSYKTIVKQYLNEHIKKVEARKYKKTCFPLPKNHICVVCFKSFGQKIQLGEHILRHHDDREHINLVLSISSKVHTCRCCEYKTTLKAQLAEHILRHHKNAGAHLSTISSKIHSCSYCEYKTTLKKNLAEHILRHHNNDVAHLNLVSAAKKKKGEKGAKVDGAKPERALFICYNCNYTSSTKKRLIQHISAGCCDLSANSAKSRLAYKRQNPSNDYVCTQCSIGFARKLNLDEHIIRKHRESIGSVSSKIHDCTQCDYKTTMKLSLDDHIVRKHPHLCDSVSIWIHQCPSCDYISSRKKDIDKHMKHPQFCASVSYSQCPSCDYKSARKSDVDKHMLTHHVADPMICEHCDGRFKSQQGLNEHIIEQHPLSIASVTRKIYECLYCPFKTTYKRSFNGHVAISHSKKKGEKGANVDGAKPERALFVCFNCNYTSSTKTRLIQHISVGYCDLSANSAKSRLAYKRQNPSNDYVCTHCSIGFARKLNLDEHIIRKHRESIGSVSSKIHDCTQCDYKTTMKVYLDRHMSAHSKAVGQLSLDDHIVKKHPHFSASVSIRIQQCPSCDYISARKKDIDKHMKHPQFSASVSYSQCPSCDYKSARKHDVDKHMLTHQVADPMICSHCDGRFKSEQGLNNHIIEQHPLSIASVTRKIYECFAAKKKKGGKGAKVDGTERERALFVCYNCNYTSSTKTRLIQHIGVGYCDLSANSAKSRLAYKRQNPSNDYACTQCSIVFTRKLNLDEHIIRKHRESIGSVSSKIHGCAHCDYKTTSCDYKSTRKLDIYRHHMWKHRDADSSDICKHCDGKRKTEQGNECSYCSFKNLTRHSDCSRKNWKNSGLPVMTFTKYTFCIYTVTYKS
nr:unnamed protein product [Callosobruchus chinensis]